jgi:hypothetical protein
VTLTVTDSDGNQTSITRAIGFLADADNDGIPAGSENQPCMGADPDHNAKNAYADPDGDGIPSVDDPDPCVPRTTPYNAIIDVNPATIPVPSKGNNITVSIRIPYRNLAQVTPSSVRMTHIAERDATITAIGWSVSGGVATATFNRQQVITFLQANNVMNHSIWIVVEGNASTGWSFIGRDSVKVVPGN